MHWYTTQLHPYTLPCSIFSTDSPSLFIISSGLQCSNEHINCKIIVWRSIYPTTTLLRSTEIESWRTKIIISKNRDINEVTVSKVPCIFSQTTKIIKLEQCSDSCTVFGHCQQRSECANTYSSSTVVSSFDSHMPSDVQLPIVSDYASNTSRLSSLALLFITQIYNCRSSIFFSLSCTIDVSIDKTSGDQSQGRQPAGRFLIACSSFALTYLFVPASNILDHRTSDPSISMNPTDNVTRCCHVGSTISQFDTLGSIRSALVQMRTLLLPEMRRYTALRVSN